MLEEFMARYGERAYALLKAILEEASKPRRGPSLGDFSFKGVKARLSSYGVEYNPAILLSKLEKEYGVIETSFRSGSQHWWRIVDREAIENAVREYEGAPRSDVLDPKVRVLRVQFASLDPEGVLRELERIASSPRLTRRELERLREIAFNTLPLIASFLEQASEYEDELAYEVNLASEILAAAERAANRVRAFSSRPVRALRGGGQSALRGNEALLS
ncbi:MAG: hypothetical protein F7B17_06250 [Desulfurococcales archaeon]|nr:hypothetical protein [Desulfurococcales archaeon]